MVTTDFLNVDLMIIVLNLVLAAIFGYAIGYFRHDKIHGAGARTFTLVSLGSCLFTIISVYGFVGGTRVDISRVSAAVVAGIGFIGAGVIWKHKEIHGVTTAAGMWVAAAVGISLGLKLYLPAVVVTIITMFILKAKHAKVDNKKNAS
ncbi:magnesium transporter MgtC [Candidatus Woesearchaeota archaeon]|nr:MAG: magnesium transporter MgtC [Candidatus Woesearchaeota archaeon]